MDTNMAKWVTCVVMCILVVGGMAFPVIKDMADPDKTYTNVGTGYALTDAGEHTITISAGENGFLIDSGNGASLVDDYLFYAPEGTGTAAVIGIGVYEAYNLDGVLVSQSDRIPTASQNIDVFRSQALAGNVDNYNGTYQLWNWYQYTLYKEMATVIMGNTDSQYMMGPGKSSGSESNLTGLTDAAYTKSADSSASVSLLLENAWGSVWEFVGDTSFANYVMKAGNALGGNSVVTNQVENKLTGTVIIPSGASRSWIESIYATSEAWGAPLTITTTTPTAGQGINDSMWSNTGNRLLLVGGPWVAGSSDGLSAFAANNGLGASYTQFGARLAYLTDSASASAPITGNAQNFGYVMTYDATAGTVSDVQALVDGSLVSVMPTGTTLNDFWNFDSTTGLGPFGTYYAAINLVSGPNGDDGMEARLSTEKGAVAYVLDPNDLHKTLAGNYFDPALYNVMLMIPTVYSYSDVSAGKLYLGSAPDTFDGITMTAYAHTYTKGNDTGNVGFHSEYEFAYGDGLILRISDVGKVTVLNGTASTDIGTVGWDSPLTLSVSGDTVSCNGISFQGLWAYLDKGGDYVLASNGRIDNDSVFVIGGYTDTTTSSDVPASIGYVLKGGYMGITDKSLVFPVAGTVTTNSSMMRVTLHESSEKYLSTVEGAGIRSVWSDGSNTVVNLDNVIVPRTLTYHNDASDDRIMNTLVMMIPVLVLFAVIMAIAYYGFGRGRRY